MLPEGDVSVGLVGTNVVWIGVNAALNLLAAIGLGVWLAGRKDHNLLGPEAVRTLSKLVYWLFQPSLVFCSVSKTLFRAVSNSGGISTLVLATMPMAAMIHIGFGYVTAQVLIKLLCIRRATEDERDIVVCCTFGNAAPLPLVFASSLFSGRPDLHADVIACISFYLMAWSPCFYTLAPLMMDASEDDVKSEDEPWIQPHEKRKVGEGGSNTTSSKQFKLTSVLTPPVFGSVAGVAVGLVPLLSRSFLTSHGFAAPLYSAIHTFSSAYLPSVLLVLAGSLVGTSVPLPASNFPLPASNLSLRPSQQRSNASSQANDSNELGQAPVEATSPAGRRRKKLPNASLRPIFCICLTRFVLMPALTFIALHLIQSLIFDDEASRRGRIVCSFVVLLESCMPSAQNSVVLLQMHSLTERAGRMSKLLTVLYVTSLLPITILLHLTLTSTGILRLK